MQSDNISLAPFDWDTHSLPLCQWLYKHKHDIPSQDEMPFIGFVAYANKSLVAMGFLRICEGGYAMIDGLTTNPEIISKCRHAALLTIVEKLLETAKQIKVKHIISFTSQECIIERAINHHGFTALPHRLIGLDLTKRT